MNLILLEPFELSNAPIVLSDRRASHILSVLHASPGDSLRIGILNGPVGSATVLSSSPSPSVTISPPTFDPSPPPQPWFDLLLAIPRPKVLHRLFAPLASLGVRNLILTTATKVERFYFDSHWLSPSQYTPLLLEGLEQSSTTSLPSVSICRAFRPFVEDVIPTRFADAPKFVAHPRLNSSSMHPIPPFSQNPPANAPRPLLAVGPEGGWTDFELNLLFSSGFHPLTLGSRALRTDIALFALISSLSPALS